MFAQNTPLALIFPLLIACNTERSSPEPPVADEAPPPPARASASAAPDPLPDESAIPPTCPFVFQQYDEKTRRCICQRKDALFSSDGDVPLNQWVWSPKTAYRAGWVETTGRPGFSTLLVNSGVSFTYQSGNDNARDLSVERMGEPLLKRKYEEQRKALAWDPTGTWIVTVDHYTSAGGRPFFRFMAQNVNLPGAVVFKTIKGAWPHFVVFDRHVPTDVLYAETCSDVPERLTLLPSKK